MANAPKNKRIDPVIGPVSAASVVPMPARSSNRGSKTSYPFELLTAIGMSFPVMNKTAAQLSSIVSNQNRKVGKTVTNPDGTPKPKFNVVLDAAGAEIGRTPLMADGKPVYETEPQKKFFAADVDKKKDKDGAIARVWREA